MLTDSWVSFCCGTGCGEPVLKEEPVEREMGIMGLKKKASAEHG